MYESRFRVEVCPGVDVGREAIRAAGCETGNLNAALKRYPLDKLKDGLNRLPGGEEFFYISNPALSLWALKSQFTA